MADYVAQTPDPASSGFSVIGEYTSGHLVQVASDLVAVISLYRRAPGESEPLLVWALDGVRIGAPVRTVSLASRCLRFGSTRVGTGGIVPGARWRKACGGLA